MPPVRDREPGDATAVDRLTADAWDAMVLVGRIVRTHGLDGRVVVHPETDFPQERFAPGSRCWTRTGDRIQPLVAAASRLQGGRPIVAFAGCDSVTGAERLVGLELRIPESELRPLAEGTYYHHQLVGCAVRTPSGAEVGVVVKVEGGAAGSLLVVEGESGEVLVPLVEAICASVDVANHRIVVTPPEGLLELNTTRPGRRRPARHRR